MTHKLKYNYLLSHIQVILLLVFGYVLNGCNSKLTSVHGQALAGKQVALVLAPGSNNPRNSEGDFVTLKSGRILFVYSHYTGKKSSDHAPAYLASRYSDDKGKTWSQTDEVVVENEGGMNVMSVSLLRLQSGDIGLFYLLKNSTSDCIPVMRVSKDEGGTWSDPKPCITDKKGYFVLNNNRVIQIRNGWLLMPVAQHSKENTPWRENAMLYCYISKDNGNTWTSSAEVPKPAGTITQEPGVVELKDGRIAMFIRTNSGSVFFSYSENFGSSWSMAEASTLQSPLSPSSITRVPGTGKLVVVWNKNGVKGGLYNGKRTPFNLAISNDEGRTWIKQQVIESDPDGWYCYTAIHFTKKDILLGHCAGSQAKGTRLSETHITRIPLKSL